MPATDYESDEVCLGTFCLRDRQPTVTSFWHGDTKDSCENENIQIWASAGSLLYEYAVRVDSLNKNQIVVSVVLCTDA